MGRGGGDEPHPQRVAPCHRRSTGRRRTMSKLDDELTGRFGKAERPLPVDPKLFAGLLKRRVRRERMKRASTVGLVLVIGVAGAMAYAVAERGATVQPGSTATISPA